MSISVHAVPASAFLLCCIFAFSSAAATPHECREPAAISLPTAIQDRHRASLLGEEHKAFMSLSMKYLSCLRSFAEENADTLTAAERGAISKRQELYIARVKNYVERWNALYGRFQLDL